MVPSISFDQRLDQAKLNSLRQLGQTTLTHPA